MCDRDEGGEGINRTRDNEVEIHRAARLRRALERLGTQNPSCIVCGENDPLVLELHHVAGQAFDNTTAILCRNCHRKLSDPQRDHPGKIAEPPDELEVIAHALLGRADFSELQAKKDREFARILLDHADPNRDNVEPQP